jgi:BlaI family penicillinase repressor
MSSSISDAEARVMEVLWHRQPLSAEEILQSLQGEPVWQLATVKTLINRLFGKGAISAEKDGRRYLYAPVLTREQWLAEQSTSLLDRLFDGHLAPLVAHFARHRKLKKSDLDALRRLLDEHDDKR